ncbi:helix-turn-helix transcriptional regulator [Bradyrhizobium sp. GCM10027634]|nr:AlpA family phage regulatory protein [Bradyrhizobium sp. WYCCWR 12677]MDN5003910.1 AlpA family phage regulatory protein [Bradyrhizobium sp. WYCCWR 12677]
MALLLTFDELKDHGVLLSRRQLDRLEANGKFPRRVLISEWRVGWVAAEVDEWVASKIRARSTDAGALGSDTGKSRSRRRAASRASATSTGSR